MKIEDSKSPNRVPFSEQLFLPADFYVPHYMACLYKARRLRGKKNHDKGNAI